MDNSIDFKNIHERFYLVKTEAGFKQAFDHFSPGEDLPGEDSSDYPKSYPCLVVLTRGYNGNDYIDVDWIPVNKLLKYLKE